MDIKAGQIWNSKTEGVEVEVLDYMERLDVVRYKYTDGYVTDCAERFKKEFEFVRNKGDAQMIKPKHPSPIKNKDLTLPDNCIENKTQSKAEPFFDAMKRFSEMLPKVEGEDMVNQPPHYKDASGIECIEVTQHMRFCEGNSFKYVYRADSKGNLIEDLKKAAWYAERSWNRHRTGNDRVHWLVKRRGEAIADSRDKEGKPFIAEVMRSIVNNRWWQAYDSLMTEIERLEGQNER